ncbi:SCO2322 family protein [Streptomyces sp. APSN-46.1]|uniref:SCO2322 family protein n=1 Tax=Streptomyces sp. APSN-46.1 TaxID=2929049 RepID=UPI001FB2968A|nr:SCO2322 family protein [Streptomyces sp. APSN-46.1]MCJ1677548.1 SCO2322 family protein [Streptomyces sp. APSN-46.1]
MRRLTPLILAFGILLTVVAATPASASTYRYWSFWDGSGGQWAYASLGPSMARPADGSAWGFRFAVSKDAGDEGARPRAEADFGAICAATPAAEGRKRVAVVIDFGTASDAPGGETPPQDTARTACAQVGPDATVAEALAEVAKPLRYNSAALLCAISGYPKQGCGEPLADAEPQPSAAPSGDGGPSAGLLAGIAAVAALATAAVWQSRRRHTR